MNANATPMDGGRLKTLRQTAGLSQQRVAELAKCSVGYVRLLEAGYRPTVNTEVVGRITAVLLAPPPREEVTN
jgi:transcriptional regulator with XRE-family HTH domain